jgi:hypothetical protein
MPDLLLPASKVRRIVDNLFQRLACPLVVAIECGVIDRVENSFGVCIIGQFRNLREWNSVEKLTGMIIRKDNLITTSLLHSLNRILQ